MLGLRLVEQLLQPLRAFPGDRLVRGDAHRPQPGLLVERLEHKRQRNGRAVRIRNQAVVLERPPAVHLRHDKRHARLEPERLGLVHAERSGANGARNELSARA